MSINNWADQACKKLDSEKKSVAGLREQRMAPFVLDTLRSFCGQDAEFAQAIVQGGSFADCMKAVANGVGDHIPDNEAFARAVDFYFPGAKIRVFMTIDLIGDAAAPETVIPFEPPKPQQKRAAKILNLADFL